MSWLVTGASGFLGGHLVEALVARGERVRVLVRPTSGTAVLDPLDVERATGDLSDPASVRAAMEGVERVVHCAALATDWAPLDAFQRANVEGVRHATEAALQAGVSRFVHVSSTDVYGYPNATVDESAPRVRRGFAYGDSKALGEEVAWEAHERGLPLTVVRPATIWGPRSLPFVVEMVELIEQGLMLHIGGGRTDAGLAYVDNVVDALVLAATEQAALGRTYNVHDGAGTTWREYNATLAAAVGRRKPWLSVPRRPAYAIAWMLEQVWGALGVRDRPLLSRVAVELLGTTQGFDTTRIRTELGWSPRVGFDEGMARVQAWLDERGTS